MSANRVSLTEGYQGAQQKNNAIHDEAGTVASQAQKQHGHTEAFQSQNKGALAMQGANGSTATANGLSAGSKLHGTNAQNSQQYLRQTAGHEEQSAQTQGTESRAAETNVSDFNARINRIQA